MWGTFCANQFDSTAANLACRQLGYLAGIILSNASGNHDFEIPFATNSTTCTIYVRSTLCYEPKDISVNIMHILRCTDWDSSKVYTVLVPQVTSMYKYQPKSLDGPLGAKGCSKYKTRDW